MKNKLELTYEEYINIIKGFKVPRLKCRITDEDLLKETSYKGDELKMSYKIEQIGYEYRGYKLGQMTDRGMIIVIFCTSSSFTSGRSSIEVIFTSNSSCRHCLAWQRALIYKNVPSLRYP